MAFVVLVEGVIPPPRTDPEHAVFGPEVAKQQDEFVGAFAFGILASARTNSSCDLTVLTKFAKTRT